MITLWLCHTPGTDPKNKIFENGLFINWLRGVNIIPIALITDSVGNKIEYYNL